MDTVGIEVQCGYLPEYLEVVVETGLSDQVGLVSLGVLELMGVLGRVVVEVYTGTIGHSGSR